MPWSRASAAMSRRSRNQRSPSTAWWKQVRALLSRRVRRSRRSAGFIPILSGGLAAAPREPAESASSLTTLTQRVSQSLGLGILNAFVTSAAAQAVAARPVLLSSPSADPRIVAFQEQGPAGLLALYQRLKGAAQTDAYSQAFLVVGLI
jgi:hypothetical protein